jgi:VWFA-related protein
MNRSLFPFKFLSIISGIFFLTAAIPVAAQFSTPDTSLKDSSVFEVRLPMTILDKKKQFVSGLTRADFMVYENGQPQEITFFSDEKTTSPVYVGVLMDTSPSTRTMMTFSKQAAKNFFQSVVRRGKDKAAFVTFDHEINLRQDFTEKINLLERAINSVRETGSNTALYDAVYQFCDQSLRSAAGRRVIVLITDGDDTFSRAELRDAIDIAQRTETVIYGISTSGGFLSLAPGVEAGMSGRNEGDKILARMTNETGGEAFFIRDSVALENAFARIASELHSQYVLSYRPSNQEYDGRERKIEVRFTDERKTKNYKIRTKTKYRAIPDPVR